MNRRSIGLSIVLFGVVLVGGIAFGVGTVSAADGYVDVNASVLNGTGTSDDPYQIWNVSELQAIEDDLTANYVLKDHIDASGTSEWNEGAGFVPLARDTNSTKDDHQGTMFTGTFDGNGYTISNLTIDRPAEDYIGLFGWIDSNGTVTNTSLEAVDVTGNNAIGPLSGKIDNSVVNRSSATGTVTSTGEWVGGLVGRNWEGTVSQSYAAVDVSGSDDVGGLVGKNHGAVTNSYATGNVSGDVGTGGLVGTQDGGTVDQSYATGNVSGETDTGGLVGFNSGTIADAYWDVNTTGQDTSAGGTGLTTSQLKANTSLNFDFDDTWSVIDNGTYISYPFLQDNTQSPEPGVEPFDTENPIADAGSNQTVDEDTAVQFDGTGSSDNVGVTSYEWDFDDGSTGTGATPTHTYADPGTFGVILTVSDDAGNSATDTITVTVEDTTPPSVSAFAASNPSGQDVTVSFDSDEQLSEINVSISGAESTILNESDFTGTDANGTYTHQSTYTVTGPGTYTVTLKTATDTSGNDGARNESDSLLIAADLRIGEFAGEFPGDTGEHNYGDVEIPIEETNDVSTDSLTVTLRLKDSSDRTVFHATNESLTLRNETATIEFGVGEIATPDEYEAMVTAKGSFAGETTATESFTIESTPSGGDTGSSPSGSSRTSSVEYGDTGEITIRNPQAGERLVLGSDSDGTETALSGVTTIQVDRLGLDIETDRDFTLTVITFESDLEPSVGSEALAAETEEQVESAANTFEEQTNTVSAGYINVDHDLGPDELSGATFEFRIEQAYLDTLGVSPEDVTLYRQTDGGWNIQATEHVDSNGTHVGYEGTAPGFSVFAIGTSALTIDVTDVSLVDTSIRVGDEATVTATIENRGRLTSEETVELTLGGTVLDSTSVELGGGETKELTLAFIPEEGGWYELSMGGRTLGPLNVEASDEEDGVADTTESGVTTHDTGGTNDTGITIGPAVLLMVVFLAFALGHRRRTE